MTDNARRKSNARKSPSSDRPHPRPNVPVCEGLPQQRRVRIKKRAKATKSHSSDRPRTRPNVPVCEELPQQRRLRIKKRAKTQNLHVRFMTANIGSMHRRTGEHPFGGSNRVLPEWRTQLVCHAAPPGRKNNNELT